MGQCVAWMVHEPALQRPGSKGALAVVASVSRLTRTTTRCVGAAFVEDKQARRDDILRGSAGLKSRIRTRSECGTGSPGGKGCRAKARWAATFATWAGAAGWDLLVHRAPSPKALCSSGALKAAAAALAARVTKEGPRPRLFEPCPEAAAAAHRWRVAQAPKGSMQQSGE